MSDAGRIGRTGNDKSSGPDGRSSPAKHQPAAETTHQLDGIDQDEPEQPAEVALVDVDDRPTHVMRKLQGVL